MFQSLVTDKLTIEHKYLSAMMKMSGVLDHPLFVEIPKVNVQQDLSGTDFMDIRGAVLRGGL